MAHGGSQTGDGPTFRAGFTGFTVRDRWVNLTGYGIGVGIWLGTYSLATRVIGGPVEAVLSQAATWAAVVTSVYFVVLYAMAIGSPFGNLFAPSLITVGLPGPVYRALAPFEFAATAEFAAFTSDGGFALSAFVVSIVIPFLLVMGIYWLRSESTAWERRVMADTFTLSGWFEAQATDGDSVFEQIAFRLYLRATVILVVLIGIGTTVAHLRLLPSELFVSTSDFTGTLLVVAFLLSLRYA